MRAFHIALVAAAIAVAALLAGSVAQAEPRAASGPANAASKNIVQTAVAAGQFKTLVTLVKTAGLASTLSAKGPFTVFAPTDAAFAKVPKSTLAALAKDKAKLKSVLLYHVASGKVPAAKVVRLTSVKTLNGQSAKIRVSNGKVFVAGARVVTPDLKTSNGVIHVINKVLIPSG
jgi:uncharacterized surface protein with fasciclin (FAS1) repeats